MKHGVTNEEVLSFLQKIRLDSSYSSTQNNVGSIGRLDELEKHYIPANEKVTSVREYHVDQTTA